ncbi:hypothetical protein [Longimicrobium sp.]|uniref:hypothetical protein n=1 Tax=Longimicrobium sp. TaxID=2029185 RepID=UPI003B3A875A
MKKLTLELDALTVASFETVPEVPQSRGTVDGYVITPKCVVTGGVNSCWCTERTCP